jgi:nucleotide-binding universal stress UspA family protein
MEMYRKILAATDGSQSANKAVRHAAELAKTTSARLTIVNVTQMWSSLDIAHAAEAGARNPIGEYEAMAAKSAERILAAAKALATADGADCETLHVQDRAPAEGIIAAAKDKGCDLIVMGTHGRRGLERLLLGSQAVEVLSTSNVPVLVVR